MVNCDRLELSAKAIEVRTQTSANFAWMNRVPCMMHPFWIVGLIR